MAQAIGALPINFIICNGLKKEKELYDASEKSALLKKMWKPVTHRTLYEIPCDFWAKKCYIKFVMVEEEEEDQQDTY